VAFAGIGDVNSNRAGTDCGGKTRRTQNNQVTIKDSGTVIGSNFVLPNNAAVKGLTTDQVDRSKPKGGSD
jgi:hypothetical protein